MPNERNFYLAQARVKLKNRITLSAGENSVIDNRALPDMPRGSVAIISEDVYEIMRVIEMATHRDNAEFPFVLYGRTSGQTVFFDDIDADYSASESSIETKYTSRMVDGLSKFVKDSPKDGTRIVAHGHTHPRIGGYYLNFSLGDMISYMQMRKSNPVFDTSQIELCSVLLTGGNYNFLFYDGNDYYKFNQVFVQKENGRLVPLPCYGPDVSLNHSRGRGY